MKNQNNNFIKFIENSKKSHGDEYDYSKVNYISARTQVEIICKKHGCFFQLPYNHIIGKGCKKCAIIKTSNKIKLSKEEFIERSIKKHKNKYDYSKVNYINLSKKIIIICPKHGEFYQLPNNHIKGHGCLKFGHIKNNFI